MTMFVFLFKLTTNYREGMYLRDRHPAQNMLGTSLALQSL